MGPLPSLEEIIAAHPFFNGLDPKFLPLLGDCASLRRFGSHQRIFQERGEADHFYLILSGQVILETEVPPHGILRIETLSAGEALGWSWLFPPYEWCFTAVTTAPTDVMSFSAPFLRRQTERNAEFANEFLMRLAKTVAQRLKFTRQGLVQLYGTLNEPPKHTPVVEHSQECPARDEGPTVCQETRSATEQVLPGAII
jgi:signal-transduction protein with cAMP-binding, CBS, and nucleotidyltransferase domain